MTPVPPRYIHVGAILLQVHGHGSSIIVTCVHTWSCGTGLCSLPCCVFNKSTVYTNIYLQMSLCTIKIIINKQMHCLILVNKTYLDRSTSPILGPHIKFSLSVHVHTFTCIIIIFFS